MKQFSILRYLKQFRLLIFLVSIIGALLVLLFGISQQHYVASAVIQYTNSEAKQGYTPDGSPLLILPLRNWDIRPISIPSAPTAMLKRSFLKHSKS